MKRKHLIHNSCGAILPEYAISFLMILPIIAAAVLLFYLSPSGPKGAIVNRGESSLAPSQEMSPVDYNKYCAPSSGQQISEEFCY